MLAAPSRDCFFSGSTPFQSTPLQPALGKRLQGDAAQARTEIGTVSRACAPEISAILARALNILTQARLKLEAHMRAVAADFGIPYQVSPTGIELVAFEAKVRHVIELWGEQLSQLPKAPLP
jgi:hypothetical protein